MTPADVRDISITVTPERARREAMASAARRRAGATIGPLDGVSVVWKDNVDIAGTVTTNGSLTRRSAPVADADAPAVATLASAGAVCLGKTNLSEFAFTGLGLTFVAAPRRRVWVLSAAVACLALTVTGVLSGLGVIGSLRIG